MGFTDRKIPMLFLANIQYLTERLQVQDCLIAVKPQQNIFKFPMVLEEETQQKLEISSEKTTRKGKFPFHVSDILGNCAFPLSFHRENSNEILIFFAVNLEIRLHLT